MVILNAIFISVELDNDDNLTIEAINSFFLFSFVIECAIRVFFLSPNPPFLPLCGLCVTLIPPPS